jgi:nitrogen fixation/metabolism regulation signal transduction histidine kinase
MIVLSLLVSGGVAILDHKKQNEEYNRQRLFRKEDAIKKSMEYILTQHDGTIAPDSIPVTFNDKICELTEVHDLFISLYDMRGRHLISSNSWMKDSIGIPEQLSYAILKQLSAGTEKAVIDSTHKHENRSLAYWYFTDDRNKPLAITSVAYVNDNSNKDIKAFLRELAQSYVVLLLIASVLAYFLSSYITRSLQYIGEQMQLVKVGRENALLKWDSKDEIGSLVKEYNRMLGELKESAEMLAKEERESAWREMARQVAHEIKNPLTPMKLRVQYLQKAWADKAPDFETKLHAFSESMTEQIDTLSRIAGEFSNFAQLPKARIESVDVISITKNVLTFYETSDKAALYLRIMVDGTVRILADKDLAVRAINNLIANALQAIPENQSGAVWVTIRPYKEYILIRISDNGKGISEAEKSKIFTPNFTTKTTGTGLGLAMVRDIMTQCKGAVWFWSKEKKGASFYLAFKRL